MIDKLLVDSVFMVFPSIKGNTKFRQLIHKSITQQVQSGPLSLTQIFKTPFVTYERWDN